MHMKLAKLVTQRGKVVLVDLVRTSWFGSKVCKRMAKDGMGHSKNSSTKSMGLIDNSHKRWN